MIDGVQYVAKSRGIASTDTTLGEVLASLRKASRYNLDEASQKSSISRTYLWELESGNATDPSFAIIVRLAKLYGVDLEGLAATIP